MHTSFQKERSQEITIKLYAKQNMSYKEVAFAIQINHFGGNYFNICVIFKNVISYFTCSQ